MKTTFLTILVFCCLTGNAQNSNDVIRKGIVFGTSLGVANANMNFPNRQQNNTDFAMNWKFGYMLNPSLALILNGAVSVYDYKLSDRPRKRDFGGIFPSMQYWINKKIWVLGGAGIGTDAPVFYDLQPDKNGETNYYSGLGVISSVGYEIYHKKNFTIDIQARINYSSLNLPCGKTNGLNTGLLLGINFY